MGVLRSLLALALHSRFFFVKGSAAPSEQAASALCLSSRDEAHRFAIKANRKAKRIDMQVSILDSIRGIGPKTKERLFNKFKSINAILNSDINDLQKVKGVDRRIANEIKKLESS